MKMQKLLYYKDAPKLICPFVHCNYQYIKTFQTVTEIISIYSKEQLNILVTMRLLLPILINSQ